MLLFISMYVDRKKKKKKKAGNEIYTMNSVYFQDYFETDRLLKV